MTSEEYVANGCQKCPHCGSDDIRGDAQMEPDGETASQTVRCADCDSTWEEVYRIEGFVNLQTPKAS